MYQKVLDENPKHAKVLQQLGWLYHLPYTGFTNGAAAVANLTKSLDAGIAHMIFLPNSFAAYFYFRSK